MLEGGARPALLLDSCEAAACQQAGARQRVEVVRGVGDTLIDLVREVVDGSFALREHVDDLRPSAASERLGDLGEGVKEAVLGCAVAHQGLILLVTSRLVKYSNEYLTNAGAGGQDVRKPARDVDAA